MSLNKALQDQAKVLLDDLDEEERLLHQEITDRFRGLHGRIEAFFGLTPVATDQAKSTAAVDESSIDVKVTTE